MGKEVGVLLSKRVIPRLQKMLRWFEHERKKEPHRRRGAGSTGSSRTRTAYCKNDAGEATTIDCYLDTDETGTEITVTCKIYGGGNLNEAEPYLTDGEDMPVYNDNGTWKSRLTFIHREPCS